MLTTIRRTGTQAAAPTPGAASLRPGAEAADQALNGYDTITIGFQLENIGKSD